MARRDLERLLAELTPFSGLRDADLTTVAACGQNVSFAAGTYLFREGEPADRFFLLRQGRLALEAAEPGRGALVIDTIGPGEVAGFSWLFPPYRWQFDGHALDRIAAVAFDGSCLRGKCDGDPRLGYELMKHFSSVMTDRMQSARIRLLDLYGQTAG
ncbi:MAG: cyclic nucleotide-binding domain-containing protein [Actinomycetota bacterium]